MPAIHESLTAGRWSTFSLAEQMGNIGSDVHRAIIAWEKKDTPRFEHALDRALELFDLTLADERWYGGRRLREIARARETFCSLFFDVAPYDTPERFDNYFTQFAIAARRNR